MSSITFYNNVKKEYRTFNEFSDARDVLRYSASDYVSFYDMHGDTHIFEFRVIHGGVECCGRWHSLENVDIYDCTGGHYSSEVYNEVAKIVRYESDDVCGLSI